MRTRHWPHSRILAGNRNIKFGIPDLNLYILINKSVYTELSWPICLFLILAEKNQLQILHMRSPFNQSISTSAFVM